MGAKELIAAVFMWLIGFACACAWAATGSRGWAVGWLGWWSLMVAMAWLGTSVRQ